MWESFTWLLCLFYFGINLTQSVVFTPHLSELVRQKRQSERVTNYEYDYYLNFKEMENRLSQLNESYPDILTLEVGGKSRENRNIYLVKIGSSALKREEPEFEDSLLQDVSRSNQKPIIFVDGGIHAREWVSPAAAFYLIDQLLETPSLTSDLEWWVMPMVNPDGYVYSHTSRKARFWRKNRAKTRSRYCRGVDLNRNFDIYWRSTNRIPCSETYGGTAPFSEPESRAVRDAVSGARERIQAYITLHTYGQLILHPYGYTRKKQPPNKDDLVKMAKGMADAIYSKYSNTYKVNQASVLGAAAGGSDDWAYVKMKIPYSYTFELQDKVGRDLNFVVRGFNLPASRLPRAVAECWEALKYLGEQIISQKKVPQSRIKEVGKEEENEEEEYEDEDEEGEDEDEEEEEKEQLETTSDTKDESLPVGWSQIVREIEKIKAELKANSTVNKTEGCIRRGNMFICPHMVFWGTLFTPQGSTE